MTDSEFRYLIETHRITLFANTHGWEARVCVEEAPNLVRHELANGKTAVDAVEAIAAARGWLTVTNLPLFQAAQPEKTDDTL